MYTCRLCGNKYKLITNTHLNKVHETDLREYISAHGNEGCGFAYQPQKLAKDDPRYLQWRDSLGGRDPWNKGHTKNTHPLLAIQSKIYIKHKINHFAKWHEEMVRTGAFRYPPLAKSKELAYLIGLILGDGHLQKLPRVERLEITLGTDKPELWAHTAKILEIIFSKKPKIRFRKTTNCLDLVIHQKRLSKRLGIPLGARGNYKVEVPRWISRNKELLVSYLKGLFEAEGSFSIHLPTCTYNLSFSNKNVYLLNCVESSLIKLGFHPERRINAVRLRKRAEALAFCELISFRKFDQV